MDPSMNFTSFMPQKEALDFTTVVAGPSVTAVGDVTNYEHRCQEHAEKHSPMSLYEMETMENPHSYQRQLIQRLFARTDVATAQSTGEPPVTLFRRLTDSVGATQKGEPEVNFIRRVTDTFKEAAFGSERSEN